MKNGEISRVTRTEINSRVSEATFISSTDGIAWGFEVTGIVDGLSFNAYMGGMSSRTRWVLENDYRFTAAQKSAIRRACDKLNEVA